MSNVQCFLKLFSILYLFTFTIYILHLFIFRPASPRPPKRNETKADVKETKNIEELDGHDAVSLHEQASKAEYWSRFLFGICHLAFEL